MNTPDPSSNKQANSCGQVSCQDSFEFEVTIEDIRNGRKLSPCNCPVAQALKRKFGTTNVMVSYEIVIDNRRYDIPKDVRIFMVQFDTGKLVAKNYKFTIP